ncbi:hypothetical protein PybrP1_009206 [[Pythium] brassicae (nom. inval.)]|nr:hypothetical protein PybrP1_009206 [[Pythium] brassicae (nom. inval.)]
MPVHWRWSLGWGWLAALALARPCDANLFSPQDVPGPPEKLLISAASDSAVRVQFLPPERAKAEGHNGAPVLGYKVEVAKRVNDVQTFKVEANGPVLAGAYRMTYANAAGAEVTACVPWNATEVEFEMALEELPNVDSVSVSRSAFGTAAANGFVYSIEFDGRYLVSGEQPNVLVGDQTGCQATLPRNRVLAFTGAHVTRGVPGYVPEVWEVVSASSVDVNVLGGSFALSLGFEGLWKDSTVTATVAPGSKTASTTPSMVGKVNRGDAIKIGGEVFTVHATAPFTDTELPLDSYHIRGAAGAAVFVEDTALGDVAVTQNSQVVATATSFKLFVAVGEHVKIGGVEFSVSFVDDTSLKVEKIGLGFDDKWLGVSRPHITAYKRKKVTLDANAEAVDVKRALDGLPGIGKVDVARLGPTRVNGYRWLITFLSLGSKTNCPSSPCLHADKVTGTAVLLTDVFGATCAACAVTATPSGDESQTQAFTGITGQYSATSVVATKEVDGLVDEVQTISTQALADDIGGIFAVNFRNSLAQSPVAVVNYDDTALDVQVKLQNLPTVGRLNVTRSDNAAFGVTWTITFLSNVGDQPLFLVNPALLTGTGATVVVKEVVKGVEVPFEAIVDGLSPQQPYYVRAYARNMNGYGAGTDIIQRDGKGALPLYASVGSAPDAPAITGLWPVSGSELEVKFSDPVNHGAAVQRFIVEYAVGTSFGTPAVKRLSIFNSLANDIAGTFRLQYGDETSPLLSVHASSSKVADELRTLSNLRPVTVTRATYVLTGEPLSRVQSFVANTNVLTTTQLTALQSRQLVAGSTIRAGTTFSFTVKTQPSAGSTMLEVQAGHGVADFTGQSLALLKVDGMGSESGPHGYEWLITFAGDIDAVAHQVYPGLQLLSSLTSVETGTSLATVGLSEKQAAIPPAHYGSFEVSNDATCDTYVVGAPSPVQVLQLFAPTTITQGTFQLELGWERTACITLGTTGTKSSMKAELEALAFVSRVTIEEQRLFKVSVLTGSDESKVTGVNAALTTITLVSSKPGLTAIEAAALRKDALIMVSRNPNDFSRHACEFRVMMNAAEDDTTLSVTAVGACTSFSGESRALKVLDFHDYKIRFWGSYPTGAWPTLKIVPTAFGIAGTCTAWAPAVAVHSKIHTVRYEGVCGRGYGGSQTILGDAASEIGGWFSLSYLGVETPSLAFKTATASDLRAAIDSITAPGTVSVTVSQYGLYGKAWRVTFLQQNAETDTLFVKHAYLTGQSAYVSVYPTVEVFTEAKQNDISGTFRLAFGGIATERIAYAATHMKVTQELQKLDTVDSVIALGDTASGDVGVYSLALTATATVGSSVLGNVQLDSKAINPTLFVAIREKLTIGTTKYWVQAITPVDITLTDNYVGAVGVAAGTKVPVNVMAGLITRGTIALPGYVGISRLMRVITATKGQKTVELPADHGYTQGNVFFVAGQKLTVNTIANGVITTLEDYNGASVVAAAPELYVFDNKLRTTEDLRQLVSAGDDLWLRSVSSDIVKYSVTQVDKRYLLVDGVFVDSVVKRKAYHVTNGRRWSLVFRSYSGDLEAIDAVPANDWRGTEARIGAREARTVQARTVRAGNPAVTQTVLLEANSVADIGAAAEYALTFGDETTTPRLPWTSSSAAIKTALEALDGIDGVTVRSTVYENGFIHTITFWGVYPTPTLPVLSGAVFNAAGAAGSVAIRVRSNNAVARSKQEAIVLESDQTYQLRVIAVNAKGMSDSKATITTRSALASVVPTPPTSVSLGEYHGETWLSVHYRPPFYTGGAEITMYRLEWDSTPTFDSSSADYGVANIQKRFEVQQVTTVYRSDANIGGTFTLSWGGRTTTALAVDCSAAQMADALAVITDTVNVAVDPVKVTRVAASWGYTWKITFLHTPGDLALLVADRSLMAGDFPRIVVTEIVKGFSDLAVGDFTHEVQDVFTDANTLLGGSFKLEFEGKLSRSISVDSSALEMQAALQDTTSIYSIKVTKTWRYQQLNTALWSVTFAYLRGEELVGAGNVFTIAVADATALTGTSAAVQVANKVTGSDPFTYTIAGLRTGVKYYFHAMAYNAEGFGSANSPMSSAVTCGHPEPPKSVVATVVDGKTLAVTWAQNEKNGGCPIDRYRVEWYRAEGIREEQTITTSAGKGLPEVQKIVNFADSQSLGGYFKMRFLGETTENVPWNAPAIGLNSVKERLERLSTVGTVDVTREQSVRVVDGLLMTANGNTLTRHASSTAMLATYGYQWRVTFLSGHVGPQELIEAIPSDSWAGNNPGINVESVQKGLQPISGTFRLSFASRGISQTTLPLAHDVSASDMKVALENLVTMGPVAVSRSQNGFGYNWVVTFLTDVKSEISLLGVDGTELHGPSVRIMAALTTIGTQPTMYCEKNGAVGVPAEIQVPGSLRYVISGLQTGQRYAVRVRARNEHGYGGDGSISPSFQIPRSTPLAPKDVKLIVLSDRVLKVRWNAPLSDGGALITSYKIQWDTANGFTNVGSPNYDMFGELRVQPTDSSPFFLNFPASNLRSYYVRVIAVNDQGDGVPEVSDPLSASPLSRTPGQPENTRATVLSSYAVLVEWEPSSSLKAYYGGDGGLPITQYMIEWDSSDTFDSPAAFGLASGTARSYIIGGNDPVTGVRSGVLTPGTMYYVRVTSFNAKGAGTPRSTVPPSVIAANQVPTSPRDLQLTVIPATSIGASWTNPLYDGGANLKSYQVEWDEQDDFSSGQSSKATIPIVREMQSIAVSTEVVNEEQFVDATVEVTNEQQVVRTVFTGADEVQIIETKNSPVVNEVQSITTSATDRDEVQELRLDGDDVNEIQAIRTSVGEVPEVQTIRVVANRLPEVQTITMLISGAATDLSNIGGDISLSFDTSSECTHCTLTRGIQTTGNLILSLKKVDNSDGASVILDALNALPNIGANGVTVTRTSATVDADLTFVYSITFVGGTVTGNVPSLRVVSAVTVNTNTLVMTIPNFATEALVGNEVTDDPLSVFTVKFTCESYSDPLTIKSYSTACTPPLADRVCPACITAFNGAEFTLSADVSATVAVSDRLVAGACVFEVQAITAATISVDPADVGALCSTFNGQALDLFKARKYAIDVPVKSAATKLTIGSVAEGLLKTIIGTVSVTQSQFIDTTANLVGSVYTVSFINRSGMIPLLECSAANIKVTRLGGGALCTVQRTTIGSMIGGSFVLGLPRQSDGTIVNTAAIPWDASEALMKSTLEAVTSNNVKVFGTVGVKRGVFLPTANKWSGGFTWTIEFLDRGWNIPTMTVVTNSLVNSDAQKAQPAIAIEDALNPLPLFPAKSRDGNQVGGTITFAFGGKTSIPCIIGTHTSLATLDQVIVDTTLANFLVAQLSPAIPSIQVTRSAATQARGFTWTITFSDKATGGDVLLLDIPLTGLTGTNARAKMFETIRGNQLGGTFQLKFNGETTGPILFSADKLSVQAQLNSLSTIKPSSVEVDRLGPDIDVALNSQVLSYTWLITFTSSVWVDPTSDHSSGIPGNWKGARTRWDDVWPETGYSKAWGRQVGPMWGKNLRLSCIKDGLTTAANDNSQSCVAAEKTPGVGPIKGTFKVSLDSTAAGFMSVKKAVTSASIAHNAWATKAESGATGTSVEEILENMENVGDVAVTRSQVNKLTGGYTWTVTFLRDKNGPCEQEEESVVVGVRLCNSPGDVPAMVADGTGLSGASPTAGVCEKTAGNCYPSIVQNGLILRGDFTTFAVANDPGFSIRYSLKVACALGAAPPCNPVQFFTIPVGSEMIGTHLQQGDRFTVGAYSTCVFQVVTVAAGKVEVVPLTCATMLVGMADAAMPVSIRVPWNADEGLVKRVLEASSDQANEVLGSVWAGGRKVSVKRTIHGKYGEVSWLIRFISNPTFTPPGAGNLPDIATVFAPNPASTFQVTVTQVTPGSVGLSGSFLVDFHSTVGPRQIRFDEDEERFQRKLNEMNTIGRVIVKKIKLPSTATGCKDSSCSGGWDDQPVDVPGTRGGYRWRIRFMKVTGEFGGLTFPSGSGNVGPLSVTLSTLQGNQKSIDVTTNLAGSSPILGGFGLNVASKATPLLPYSSTADSIKQGIESMYLFGEVDVTRDYLVSQQIPGAIATLSKDGLKATIDGVDDIRQFVAPGDIVRFGASSSSNLVGTSGDSPFTSVLATSRLRIDGLVYDVQRSGRAIQTVSVTLLAASWNDGENHPYFKLKLTRGGAAQTTACLDFNAVSSAVETELNAKLLLLDATAKAGDIKVTRAGPLATDSGARRGYVYSVYFLGDTVAGDVSTLEAIDNACTTITDAQVAVKTVTHGGVIGQQRLLLATNSGQVVDTQGYFTLTLNGVSTPCLTWGVSAADLEAKLETVLLTGDVLVSRRGSGNSVTEVQRLRLTSNSEVTTTNTGLFQLLFMIDGKTAATGCLAYGVSAEDLQLAINGMSNLAAAVHHVNVTRDGDGSSAWGYGYEYLINFRGPVAGSYSPVLGDVEQLQIINVGKSPCAPVVGGNPALILETVRQGAAAYTYDIFFLDSPAAVTPDLLLKDENAGACNVNVKWVHNGGSARKAWLTTIAPGGSSEVQSLVVKDATAAIPAGAQYYLSFGGPTVKTVCIAFNALASVVQARLEALASVGVGGVRVSRDVHPIDAPNGFVYKITFVGQLVTGNVPSIAAVVNDGTCTNIPATASVSVTTDKPGGLASGDFVVRRLYDGEQPGSHVAYSVSQLFSVMSEQFEVQKVTVLNPGKDLTTETYKLGLGGGAFTTDIKWNADEGEMEAAFSAIPDGDVVVTRRTDTVAAPNGYVYTIYFSGVSVQGNHAEMTAVKPLAFATGDVKVLTVSGGVDGVAPFKEKSIPLALVKDSTVASPYLAPDATLNVYKVNGFFWTIKFKSTVGNIPALGMQTSALTGKLALVDDFVAGSASNAYVLANLFSGINYYVRVAAGTEIGLGPFTALASAIPSGVTSPVQNVALGYALHAREVQEVRLAATHITEIQEITTSAATMAEVQTLRTYASSDVCFDANCIAGGFAFRVPTIQTIEVSALAPISAGSFSIGFVLKVSNGAGAFTPAGAAVTTAKIAWNAAASAVQTALEALDGIDPGDIVVTRDGDASSAFNYGYIYSVTFVGNNVAGQTPTFTLQTLPTCAACDAFVVAGGMAYTLRVSVNPALAMGTDTAVQEVIVKADKALTAGSYMLKFLHLGAQKSSGCIVFDAPARGSDVRAMENILMQMPNIDKVYVTRKLDAVAAPNGFVYRIFFYGNGVYGDVELLEFEICTPFQTQENNVLTESGVNRQILISIVDRGGFDAANTFVDAKTATADQLNQDLNRLPVFGDVIVSRSLADEQGGFIWTVAFKDSEGNLPQFICAVDAAFKAKPGAKCETSTLTDGNVLSGTFIIDSSVPINFDANAATVKAALEAMAWVGAVQVVQSPPTAQLGYTWTITFLDYFGDVPPLAVTSSLVGTSASIQVREVRKGNIIAGTFTLSYKGESTAPIRWNAPGSAVSSGSDGSSLQEKLEALEGVGPVTVERSAMDREGGITWRITFLDNMLNPGDVPLLQANALSLSGVGVVVFVREVRKGSEAVGDQLWLSFDPPQSDNGGPITKYQVRWDTSATFAASPAEYFLADPDVLFRTQRIVTSAPSLAWSSIKTQRVLEVQSLTVANTAANTDTFRLTFRGATTAVDLIVGTSTAADVAAALTALSTVGTVVVTPVTTMLNVGEVVQVTFTSELGDLPPMTSNAKVVIAETQKGVANFRKEVVVFSCLGAAGKTVKFTYSGNSVDVTSAATLAILETSLHTLFNVEAGSISVLSSQTLMCAAVAPALDVTIVFDRVYGDLSLAITSADATVTLNADASIDGVYRDVPTAKMSGTFQVGYKGKYTRSLNAESSADDVRYALEDLDSVTTAAVAKDLAYQAVPGKLDVTKGQIFATCSAGETCDFRNAGYGLPGYKIRISGRWYTVRTDTVSDAFDGVRLYLGDLNGRETGYVGESQTGVVAYEWTKGYEWTVSMLKVDAPLSYLRAKIPRLYPSDSAVAVRGSSCDKCYYIPAQTTKKLTIGQEYFVEVVAFNDNGRGLSPVGGSARGTPSQVPNAPSNVDLVIVSGKELEVFFSPPVLAATNVSPNLNNDISSYIVQWDVRTDFKHGLPLCTFCAVSLKVNVLTVTSSLTTLLKVDSTFTIADENCVLKVTAVGATRIDVANGHGCNNFDARAYPLYYYVYAPAVLSGTLIQGSPPFRYLITNLDLAAKYYVRVAAVNSVPVQQIALDGNPPSNRKWSFPLSATTKDTVPDPPVSVYLYPYSGTTLEVQIQPPTRDGKGQGGAQISHFWVDFDTVSTFDSPAKAAPVDVDVQTPDIPLLYAGGPRIYYLKNLNTGVRYFVQVKARNSIGYSRATLAPNPLAPTRNPDGPVNVKVSTLTTSPAPIDAATVTWQKPVLDGGLSLTSYKVEWWGAEAQAEVQVIEVKWITRPTTALFTLAFGGDKTGDMPLDVTPENLRNALMNIVDSGGVQQVRHVLVSRTTVNVVQGYQWRVTFVSAANAGDLPMIQLDINPLLGSTDTVGRVFEAVTGARVPPLGFPGTREVQVLMTYHAGTRVQGYFRLSYKGSSWSNYLPAEISAANLKLALESLTTVGKVTVNLEGPSTNGFVWTITFDSNVGNAPALIVDSAKITPSDAFVGVKDGDNAVTKVGVLCVPGEDVCPGSWPVFKTGIAAKATPGEMVADYRFYETIDAGTLTYKITGLVPGKLYYVSVTAKNALGLGTRVKSAPISITPPVQVPRPPTGVSVGVKLGIATQITVSWSDPVSHGGDAVRMYRVEYDPSPLFKNRGQQDFWCPSAPTRAVWTVRTWRNGAAGDSINAGSFKLQLTRNNQLATTAPIPWDAVATAEEELGSSFLALSKIFCTDCPTCADRCLPARQETSGSLQSKLTYLSAITGVQVVRTATATADGGYTWTITFLDVGDDFVLAPVAPNGLACVIGNPNTCTAGDYRVTATKLTAGVANNPCTGTQTLPSVGVLNKGQLYYVRVFAYNKIGFGLPMLAPSPQKPMVVPGPPTGVTLQVMSVSDLKVIFSPPDDDGGDTVTAYQVEWSTDPAFPSPQVGVVALLAGGAPYYRVISSLVKGSFYFVRVKAANSQGYGQYQISSPASLNPYTTPSAPTKVALGVTCSTMLTVQWDKPDDDGGDTITAYVVQWDISASFDSLGAEATKVKIADTAQRSYTITLLTPDTVYFVRVLAMNAGGLGTPQTSTPPSQVPVNTRPGKPHTLRVAVPTTPGTLQVTWQVPRVPAHLIPCSGTQLVPLSCPVFVTLDVVFGGSTFESYLVQWSDNSDFTGFNWMSVTTNSALLTGLSTGKAYFVRVLTVNSEGQKSDFCARANSGGYLCPDNLVLLDGTVVTGSFVSAAPA